MSDGAIRFSVDGIERPEIAFDYMASPFGVML